LEGTTRLQGQGSSLTSTTTYQNNKTIKKVGSSKVRSILHCETNNVVVFQLKLSSSMKIHLVFHVSFLKAYHMSTNPRRIHDPLPPIEVDGKHEYEMEDILDFKIFNHQLQYLVHSHGHDVNERTWELIKKPIKSYGEG
jgi:hypothetical protein